MLRSTCMLLVLLSLPGMARADPGFEAEGWEAADRLFRGDPHWVGGDGAYSIDLGRGRVLWLFADTLVDPTGQGSRRSPGLALIGNSVAIQHGYDPAGARMHFYWRSIGQGRPAAFFADADAGAVRYWPGHGIRLGDRLVLFLMAVHEVPHGLGFEIRDWQVVLVPNPDDEPSAWQLRLLDRPSTGAGLIVGSAGVFEHTGWVYAFASVEPGAAQAHLARWRAADLREGRVGRMQWRSTSGWRSHQRARPAILLRGVGTEFTVHREEQGHYRLVHALGFGGAVVADREATAPAGPWSPSRTLYRPPEANRAEVMVYQAKAHPHLSGADLVLTYSTNGRDLESVLGDPSLYYPRFVRLRRRGGS